MSASSPTAAGPSTGVATDQIQVTLRRHIQRAGRLLKIQDLATYSFVWLAAMACVWFVACLVEHWLVPLPVIARWLIWCSSIAASSWLSLRYMAPLLLRRLNPDYVAQRIEQAEPELKTGLVSWLQLESMPNSGVPRGIMAGLARHAARHIHADDPSSSLDTRLLIKTVGFTMLLLAGLAVYGMLSPKSVWDTGKRILMPWSNIAAPARVQLVELKPGSSTLTQGKPLDIEVKLRGMRDGEIVTVRYSTVDGQLRDQTKALEAKIDGFEYFGSVSTAQASGSTGRGVQHELDYWIEAGDLLSGPHRIQLSRTPAVTLDSVVVEFPAYTKLPKRTISNGELEAVEGSTATVMASANQPLKRGQIEIDPELDGSGVLLRARAVIKMDVQDRSLTGKWRLLVNDARDNPTVSRYRVRGFNQRDDANDDPIEYRARILADVAPEVSVPGPEDRKMRMLANGQMNIEVRANDPDYGIGRLSLTIKRNDMFVKEALLMESEGVIGRQVKKWRFKPADYHASVGDRFQLTASAEDNRHHPTSGELDANRTQSVPLVVEIVAPETLTETDPAHKPPVKVEEADPEVNPQAKDKPASNDPANTSDKSKSGPEDQSKSGSKDPQDSTKGVAQDNKPNKQGDGDKSDKPNDSSDPASSESGSDKSSSSPSKQNDSKGSDEGQDGQQSNDPSSSAGGGESGKGKSSDKSSSADSSGKGGESSSSKSEGNSKSSAGQSSGKQSSETKDSGSKDGASSSNSSGKSSGSPNDSSSKSEPNDQAGNDSAPGAKPASTSSDRPGKSNSKPTHDGEAIERINNFVKDQAKRDPADNSASKLDQPKQGSGSGQPKTSSEDPKARPGQQQPGQQQPGQQQPGQQQPGQQQPGQQQQQQQQQPGQQQPGQQQPGQQQPGQQQPGQQQPGQQQPGQQQLGQQQLGQQQLGQQQPGQQQPGQQQPGQQQPGQQQPGQQQPGQQQPGQQQPGQQQPGQQQPGQQQPGQQQPGQQQPGQQQPGQQQPGQQQPGQQQPGQQQPGQQQPGQQQPGQQQPGQQQPGQQQPGQQQPGQQQPGQQQPGQQQPGQQQPGQQQPGQQQPGQQQPGQQQPGQQQPGQQQPGQQQPGQQQPGQQQPGQQQPGQQQPGQQQPGQQQPGQQQPGQQQPGQQQPGQQQPGQQQPGQQQPGQQQPGQQQPGQQQQSDGQQAGGQQPGASKPGSEASPGQKSSNSAGGGQGGSTGEQNDLGTAPGAAKPINPDAVPNSQAVGNEQYANEVTNLVLDYLKQQKDQPDPELLKELNWGKDDLDAFLKRWDAARDMSKSPDPTQQRKWTDELRALGLVPPTVKGQKAAGIDEKLKGLQDSGSRMRAPESLRRQFDAFKRAVQGTEK